jgi:heme/copper-type cytochrome/quinol oxidase subunit 2
MDRRRLVALLATTGGLAVVPHPRLVLPLLAQDQVPSRRDLTIVVADFRFTPDRIEAVQDDLVRLTVRSGDVMHSFNIDEYRIARRVPAGGSVTVEFRADRVGTFPFYCSISNEPGHDRNRGQLVVRPK